MSNSVEKLAIIASLAEGQKCSLNHGPGVEPPEAINVISLPIGQKINEVESRQDYEFSIYVCQECVEELANQNSDWVLMFCLSCTENHWVCKSLSKLPYEYKNQATGKDHKIIWFQGCPKCSGKFGGVYFQDV